MTRKDKEYTKGEAKLLGIIEDVHDPLDDGHGLIELTESSLYDLGC